MKTESIDGVKIIDLPVYKDRLMTLQGKVLAFQSHSLRVLSSKINPKQDVKLGKMIQSFYGTELRHELEGFAIDIMGEIGTLYENSPLIRDGGGWQFIYMYYLGLIIGGGQTKSKKILLLKGLGMPRETKVERELNMYFEALSEDQMFFQDSIKKIS